VRAGDTVGTCTAFVGEGGSCVIGLAPCGAQLSCVGDDPASGTPGRCVPAAELGEACDVFRKIAPTCDNNTGVACVQVTVNMTTQFMCQPMQLVGPGMVCGATATTNVQCAGGGLCVKPKPTDNTGICVGVAADGEPCDRDPLRGPPCLQPAKCVSLDPDVTTGICTMPNAQLCN
jgi:hypothetical protein